MDAFLIAHHDACGDEELAAQLTMAVGRKVPTSTVMRRARRLGLWRSRPVEKGARGVHGRPPKPKRKAAPKPPREPSLTIEGEKKNLREWAADPRCRVSYAVLLERHGNGFPRKFILMR